MSTPAHTGRQPRWSKTLVVRSHRPPCPVHPPLLTQAGSRAAQWVGRAQCHLLGRAPRLTEALGSACKPCAARTGAEPVRAAWVAGAHAVYLCMPVHKCGVGHLQAEVKRCGAGRRWGRTPHAPSTPQILDPATPNVDRGQIISPQEEFMTLMRRACAHLRRHRNAVNALLRLSANPKILSPRPPCPARRAWRRTACARSRRHMLLRVPAAPVRRP